MYILILSLSSTDVPFKNGKYIHGYGLKDEDEGFDPAFYSLSRSSIQSDSSFFLLIHFIYSLFKSQTANSILLEFIIICRFSFLFVNSTNQNLHTYITLCNLNSSQ